MNTVAVLLSAYNGEKYIEEQIESILNQKNVKVFLLIRDDGSVDSTLHILEGYKGQSNIQVILGENNLKPANSFMKLLYAAPDCDYYAFADQDDIWLEDKLSCAIQRIIGINGPALYGSNQTLYSDGMGVKLRFDHTPPISLISTLFSNHVAGCTMVFNRSLAGALRREESRPSSSVLSLRMHDTWVMLAALLLGEVFYDDESHILYRVHAENVVGVKYDNIGLIKRAKLILRFIHSGNCLNYRSIYARELLKCFSNMKKKDREMLELLSGYRYRFATKAKLLQNRDIQKDSGENRVSFLVKVLLNIY